MTTLSTPREILRPADGKPYRLLALGLSSEHVRALAQQGFVCSEYRGKRGPFFKLRFRLQGRQVVKYLGMDVEEAERVRRELAELQRARRGGVELRRATLEARKILRSSKRMVWADAKRAGFEFHGRSLRQRKTNVRADVANVET